MVKDFNKIVDKIYEEMSNLHLIDETTRCTLRNKFNDGETDISMFIQMVFNHGFKCGLKRCLDILHDK